MTLLAGRTSMRHPWWTASCRPDAPEGNNSLFANDDALLANMWSSGVVAGVISTLVITCSVSGHMSRRDALCNRSKRYRAFCHSVPPGRRGDEICSAVAGLLLDGAPPELPVRFDVLRCPDLHGELEWWAPLRQPRLLDRGIDRSQQLTRHQHRWWPPVRGAPFRPSVSDSSPRGDYVPFVPKPAVPGLAANPVQRRRVHSVLRARSRRHVPAG